MYLEDVMVGGQFLGPDVDVDPAVGSAQEVLGQLLHLPRPGGRPHEDLSVRTNLLEDLPDLGLEAHVQHPVGLVEDEVGGPPEVHLASLQEVNKTSRGRDANLCAILNVSQLGSLGGSSEHAGILDAGRLSKLLGDFLDLLSQLPKQSLI